ncbi:MAG: calcium/sodium antiporter [bacterium]
MMPYLLVIAGFIFLIKGADYLINGATSIAKQLRISDLVVGLTIIAFGTSAPELFINIISSIQGNTDIAIGNILGSNIANILLILGITAIVYPLKVKHDIIWKDIPLSLLAVVVVGLLVNDVLIDNSGTSLLSRIDGYILLSFFAIFLIHVHTMAKASKAEMKANKTKPRHGLGSSISLIVLGIVGLSLGGRFAVDGAVALATQWGVSQVFIGLTIVAIGTSLPELVTSIVAALKRKADIAVGNIVGSNIMNIFWVLGLSSIIRPIPFNYTNNFDIVILTIASVLLFAWMLTGRKNILEKWQGVVFVIMYIIYIISLIIRG